MFLSCSELKFPFFTLYELDSSTLKLLTHKYHVKRTVVIINELIKIKTRAIIYYFNELFEWSPLQKWVWVLCCTFSFDFSQMNVNNSQIKDFLKKIDKFSVILSYMSKCQWFLMKKHQKEHQGISTHSRLKPAVEGAVCFLHGSPT